MPGGTLLRFSYLIQAMLLYLKQHSKELAAGYQPLFPREGEAIQEVHKNRIKLPCYWLDDQDLPYMIFLTSRMGSTEVCSVV